jgi:hypothetical protein
MTITTKITVSSDITPCILVDLHRRLGGTCCLHLQVEQQVYILFSLHILARSGPRSLYSSLVYPYHFSTLGLIFYPEDGCSRSLRNIRNDL